MPAQSPVYSSLLLSFLKEEHNKLPVYFEWRRNFISGKKEAASEKFALLYAAELLYLIECPSPLYAMNMLARLMNEQRELSKNIKNRLAHWLRDFYILHADCNPPKNNKTKRAVPLDYSKPDQFDFPFSWFILQKKLMWLYPEYMLGCDMDASLLGGMSADDVFDMYAGLSSYKIGVSRIMKEGYAAAARDSFLLAWRAVASRITDGGQDVASVFADSRLTSGWRPYGGLDIRAGRLYDSVCATNRRFILNLDAHREEPFAKFKFRARYFEQVSAAFIKQGASAFFGDFLKRVDYEIRTRVKLPGNFLEPEDRFDLYLDDFRYGNRHVDRTALYGIDVAGIIRDSVQRVVSKLPDNLRTFIKPSKAGKAQSAGARSCRPLASVRVSVDFNKLGEVRGEADWVFDRLTEGQVAEDVLPIEPSSVSEALPNEDEGCGGWESFAQNLTSEQSRILSLMISQASLEAISAIRGAGMTLDTFAEKVNELALRAIGDIIVETDGNKPRIISDYIEDLRMVIDGRS